LKHTRVRISHRLVRRTWRQAGHLADARALLSRFVGNATASSVCRALCRSSAFNATTSAMAWPRRQDERGPQSALRLASPGRRSRTGAWTFCSCRI